MSNGYKLLFGDISESELLAIREEFAEMEKAVERFQRREIEKDCKPDQK